MHEIAPSTTDMDIEKRGAITVPEPDPEPEPEPEWQSAFRELGALWEIHVYGFGLAYVISGAITLTLLLTTLTNTKMLQKQMTVALFIMLFPFSMARGIMLLLDPYHSRDCIPLLVFRITWSLSLPFFTSMYSILLLVLRDSTSLSIGPAKFQKLSSIMKVTVCHIIIVVVADIVVSQFLTAKPVVVLCQVLFIMYGFIMGIGYTFASWKMRENSAAGKYTDSHNSINRLLKLSLMLGFAAFAIASTNIYHSVVVFDLYTEGVDPWHWWAVQTLIRSEELFVCGLVVAVIGKKPMENNAHCSVCFKRPRKVGKSIATTAVT